MGDEVGDIANLAENLGNLALLKLSIQVSGGKGSPITPWKNYELMKEVSIKCWERNPNHLVHSCQSLIEC